MSKMIAKFRVTNIERPYEGCERLTLSAVTDKPFDGEGNSEDNSFARYTPAGELKMDITNPNLRGTFQQGQKFYLEFREATEG